MMLRYDLNFVAHFPRCIMRINFLLLRWLGCLIGNRLVKEVKQYLGFPDVFCTFWTDSSIALAWTCNKKQWARFPQNRVDEIRSCSKPEDCRQLLARIIR